MESEATSRCLSCSAKHSNTGKYQCLDCEKKDLPLGAPGISVAGGASNFRPHFDYQLGAHFSTAEEKAAFLKAKGKVQVSGPISPEYKDRRYYSKARPEMTRTQFEAWKKRRKEAAHRRRVLHEKKEAALGAKKKLTIN